jgi:hypothetical protein
MKLPLVSTAAAAALVLLAAPTFAATTDLGTLILPYNQSLDAGKLADVTTFSFHVAQTSQVNWSATSTTSLETTSYLGSATLELLSGETVVYSSAFFKIGSSYFASLGPELIAAGDYIIAVIDASGTAAISETASVTAAAVPEISAWTMMVAGFGALGFAGYRRRAAVAA